VLRSCVFVATALLAGCPSKGGKRPAAADDRGLRIRVAQAEGRRAGGVAELAELVRTGDDEARALALRGLGRIGGADALKVIDGALDDPRTAAAAIAALGVAYSLDEQPDGERDAYLPLPDVTHKILGAMHGNDAVALEALGRAGDASAQSTLALAVQDPVLGELAALALARHGRRKIPWSPEARAALFAATASVNPHIRYAAVYALAREHEPPATEPSLEPLVTDADPLVRAQAIVALVRRKTVRTSVIGPRLHDEDWRVAVEAVRALAPDEAGRVLIADVTAFDPRVQEETLRQLVAHLAPTDDAAAVLANQALSGRASCFAKAALARPVAELVDACPGIDLAIIADVIKRNRLGDAWKRAGLRALLEHADPRMRAAGIGAVAAVDPKLAQVTVAAALASKDPVIAGAAIEAIDDAFAVDDALAAAIVSRAGGETDPELSSDLYAVIGKKQLAQGADACRAGLSGPPVRARAAAGCLRALGEAVAPPPIGSAPPPPVDLEGVIGHHVTWHLETTKGAIDIALSPEIAPWNVAAIVALTRRGFYDGIAFHRVVPDFVVQGGDPTQSGWGGPGFTTPAEPTTLLDRASFVEGGVGMADAGRDSGGSQYFFMQAPAPHLDGRYTQVGRITAGQNSADALVIGDRVVHATVDIR
jgi:cyclophilin family peptidyl-prolyl cis-trans isomerase